MYADNSADGPPAVNYFAAFPTPQVRDGLHRAGADFLAQNGVEDEPLIWEPPTVTADGLETAGHDLEKIDISILRQMIRSPSVTTERAAHELGTPYDAVRVLLHRSPAPSQRRPHSRRRNDGEAMRIAKQAFPPDEFRRLYYTERRGLRQITDLASVSRNVRRRLAEQYIIEVREPNATGPRKAYADGASLRERYSVRGRPVAELGREKGPQPCDHDPVGQAARNPNSVAVRLSSPVSCLHGRCHGADAMGEAR